MSTHGSGAQHYPVSVRDVYGKTLGAINVVTVRDMTAPTQTHFEAPNSLLADIREGAAASCLGDPTPKQEVRFGLEYQEGTRKLRVLLTGSFGNLGESTLLALSERNHEVRCFDMKTKTNLKKQAELSKQLPFETIWGNITSPDDLRAAVQGVDVIIHLAAILPPGSERNPELARRVNVGGTRLLIDTAKATGTKPRIVYPSSVSAHGPRKPGGPLLTSDSPLVPTDNYTHHKAECEEMLRESGLPWTITRITAAPSLKLNADLGFFPFQIPLEQRIEFGHTRDIGTALANSVDAPVEGKVLLLGGGKRCQMTNEQFINGFTMALGLGRIPASVFRKPKSDDDWYYTDWLDTSESEGLLHYQAHTYEDYLAEMRENMGLTRHLIELFAPVVRWRLVSASPYAGLST